MTLRIRCPGCHSTYDLSDSASGQKFRCEACGKALLVVAPPSAPAPVPAILVDDVPTVEPIEEVEGAVRTQPAPKPAARPLPGMKRSPARAASCPRPESSKGVWIAVLALLLAGGAAGLAFLLHERGDEPATLAARADQGEDEKKPDGPEEVKGDVGNDPGPDVKPAAPPAPQPGVRPPKLDQAKVVRPLPGPARDVVAGGAGRFLVLHLPRQRQLAVFDANEAKVVGYVPVAADNVLFAAGIDKLMVVLPDQNLVQRWDLATRRRELTAPLPGGGRVTMAAMGSASRGPLLLGGGEGFSRVTLLDIQTCKPLAVQRLGNGHVGAEPGTFVRASADGRVFGMWRAHVFSPSGIQTLVLTGKQLRGYYEHDSAGHVVPGPDGKFVYTARGTFTTQLKRLGEAGRGGGPYCLPAHHGNFYLVLDSGERRFDRKDFAGGPAPGEPRQRVMVHLAGDGRPLVTLDDIELPRGTDPGDREDFSTDRRVHFIPAAKLIVTVPETNDRLVLHRFDLDEALEKSGVDYLFVASQPPAFARKGAALAYQVQVRSKRGGAQCRLESGPPGMSVSPAGALRWDVPADFAGGEVDVLVGVGDRSGQEVFHTFTLEVVAADAAVAVAGPPDPPAVVPEPPRPAPPPAKEPPAAPPVKPAVVVGGIKPPDLKGDRAERALPSAVGDVAVGRGGRFLVLHLPRERKLAVFDVNEAKVVKYIPVAADTVKFAAGMDKLIVVLPDANLIQRWSLTTLERELSVPLPRMEVPPVAAAMGSASDGPLVISGCDFPRLGETAFIDVRTMKRLETSLDRHGIFDTSPNVALRASADGRVFACQANFGGVQTGVWTGKDVKKYQGEGGGHAIPGPDGRVIYTSAGLFTSEMKPLGRREGSAGVLLPAHHGHYYLALHLEQGPRPDRRENDARVTVHLEGDTRPLVTLPALEGLSQPDPFRPQGPASLPLDKRVHFIPDAKLIVVIPDAADRLLLHRFDVMQALEKSDVDYLLVTSRPPQRAGKGTFLDYQLDVKSKRGGVRCKLDSGPDGMAVSPAGRLTWRVPAAFAGAEADVIVAVSDQSGQEIFHTFQIAVVDRGELPPDEPGPPPAAPEPPKPEAPPVKEPAPAPPAKPAAAAAMTIRPPTPPEARSSAIDGRSSRRRAA